METPPTVTPPMRTTRTSARTTTTTTMRIERTPAESFPFDGNFSSFGDVMSERARVVEDVCASGGGMREQPSEKYSKLIAYGERRLYWCPVFKASTSSWLRYIFDTTSSLTQGKLDPCMRRKGTFVDAFDTYISVWIMSLHN